jgi:hypothetical protein
VRAAIEKLSSHQRQVIELAYFEGISQTEMVVRMRQPLGTVKTWVRAALKVLPMNSESQAARPRRDRPVAQSSGATCKMQEKGERFMNPRYKRCSGEL